MARELYTRQHEFVRIDGDVGTVGITAYAQEQLGDVVFVEVPTVGRRLKAGEAAAVVESVKAANEVYAPLSGEVVQANAALADKPALVNEDPEGAAWFFKLHITDPDEMTKLMDRAHYDAFLKELG